MARNAPPTARRVRREMHVTEYYGKIAVGAALRQRLCLTRSPSAGGLGRELICLQRAWAFPRVMLTHGFGFRIQGLGFRAQGTCNSWDVKVGLIYCD